MFTSLNGAAQDGFPVNDTCSWRIIMYGIKMFFTAALLAALVSGCSDSQEDGGVEAPASLGYSVYAGEDAAGSWSTFAFTKDEDGKDAVYYFPNNADCYYGGYDYSGGSGAIGEVTSAIMTSAGAGPAPPEIPAPGAFTISAGDGTITFTAYAGGGAQVFRRVRDVGGNRVDDDPPPSDLKPLAAGDSLDGTVWAATAYRTRDWTTLSVTAGTVSVGTVNVSHSFDCTSYPRQYGNYVYGAKSDLDYIGPFTVSGTLTGDKWTFLNFYGHGGTITLNRMR